MGRLIASERARLGLTQEQLALRIGVSQNTVARWESGDVSPSVKHISKMADIFGITTDYLFGRTESRIAG